MAALAVLAVLAVVGSGGATTVYKPLAELPTVGSGVGEYSPVWPRASLQEKQVNGESITCEEIKDAGLTCCQTIQDCVDAGFKRFCKHVDNRKPACAKPGSGPGYCYCK